MDQFLRLLPYAWPSRFKLLQSFVFAAFVAVLWGGNLSIVFPVVTVLMKQQGLGGYVQERIAEVNEEISHYKGDVQQLEQELREIAPSGDELSLVKKQRDLARSRSKLTSATESLLWWQRAEVHIIPWLPEDLFETLAVILVGLLVLTMIKLACTFAEETLLGQVVQLTVMQLRKQAYRRVLALDYQSLAAEGNSGLMSRFTYDMETLANGLSLLGGKLVREPLKAVACMGAAFWLNWRLTLLSVLFVPLAVLVFHRLGKTLKKASHRSMESMKRIYKVLGESFDAAKVVIAFDRSAHHRRQHHLESKVYYRKSMQIVTADALTSPATEMLGMIAVLVAVLPGAYLVLRNEESIWGIRLSSGQMDIPQLSVLYAFLAGAIDPARKMSNVFSKLRKGAAAAERIFDLMDRKPLVIDAEKPLQFPNPVQSVEFRQVGFTYSRGRGRPAALDDVSISIPAGEVVAVVGENGSGKSTLVNLLPRYFDADAGSVLVNDVDIRDLRLSDLRRRIGIVTQETLLFDDTIFGNILYGNPLATTAEVEAAATAAHVMDFARHLPDGLQTIVGEKGGALSGGQRQRVALARAMLRNPAILILDEATSAIDSQSEQLIHQSLSEFVAGRTTFIITHSLTPSILQLVTKVLMMERGRLIAAGKHEDLRRTCEPYQRLLRAHGQSRSPSSAASSPGDSSSDEPDNIETDDSPISSDNDNHGAPASLPIRPFGKNRGVA